MKILIALVMAASCGVLACKAQDVNFAKELTFKEIFATRQNDRRTYVVLGSGWLRPIQFGNPSLFISQWLEQHPAATVKPVSQMVMRKTEQLVYIWVEDGEINLNVDLVRAGVFPGGVMADMVDSRKGLDELLKDPRLTAAKAEVDKERAEAPPVKPERFVSEDDYMRFAHRVEVAETQARKEKLGVWSDSMKAERDADGYQ